MTGENFFLIRVLSHDYGITFMGNRKSKTTVVYSTASYMRYSKFFFDRPSGQGFRKGLGINCVKPKFNNLYNMDMDTAMQIPEFTNGVEYLVAFDGRPWYLSPCLHALLLCCGLFYISFLITLWTIPNHPMI